jgi:hypothetical protein
MNFKNHWDIYVIFAFLLIRFFLNFDFLSMMKGHFLTLEVFFIVMYAFFFYMLYKRKKYFSTLFVLFLAIDSMIGTYLLLETTKIPHPALYWGTMAINMIIIAITVENVHKELS